MGGLGMDGHVSCFWVQSHRQRRCCICCVYTDKTRQESNLIFHADTHHIQMCSKCRHIHIHTHAHTLPSGARSHILPFCLTSPPAKTRKIDGKDGDGEKEKTSVFSWLSCLKTSTSLQNNKRTGMEVLEVRVPTGSPVARKGNSGTRARAQVVISYFNILKKVNIFFIYFF